MAVREFRLFAECRNNAESFYFLRQSNIPATSVPVLGTFHIGFFTTSPISISQTHRSWLTFSLFHRYNHIVLNGVDDTPGN